MWQKKLDCKLKILKTNVRFEISTFEMGFIQSLTNKIKEVIFFDPKCPNMGIWARNLNNECW